MASSAPQYTCEIVIHRAANVPIADLNTLSSDPYIRATVSPRVPQPVAATGPPPQSPAPEAQYISFRTITARKTLDPVFNARWLVSGIPASGFVLTLQLNDEDPGNHDDRLGKAVIRFPDPNLGDSSGQSLKEGWDSGEREYKMHKRHGSLRARLGTYIAKTLTRGRVGHRVRVFVSVRVLGPAPRLEGEDSERIYTLGPHVFVRHFSPLATRLTSVKAFKANRLQLTGPIPSALRHRYVGFAPFVKAMFRKRGIEGMILNHALHKQHGAIYKWDKNTVWGIVEDDTLQEGTDKDNGDAASERPDQAFARKFLEMVEYGTEGRIYTYAIMLDGQWRFTETGEEFAIGLLSKHTMHTDVAVEIAYSGEFFVRRIQRKPYHASRNPGTSGHPDSDALYDPQGAVQDEDGDPRTDGDDHPSKFPPSEFELVIDNDSGTYRPRKDLLPVLGEYLSRPSNLGALGRVRTMDGFDKTLEKWKNQRKEEKKGARQGGGKREGGMGLLRQASVSSSGSSLSSSDDGEAVAAAAEEAGKERRKANGHEDNEGGVANDQRKTLQEGAQRAEENEDDDAAAREETRHANQAG